MVQYCSAGVTRAWRALLTSLLPFLTSPMRTAPSDAIIAAVDMSQRSPTPSSSSNLQAIFVASLKEYEKKTKQDLVTHPLMAQFQTCNSPADILTVLRAQVQQFEQSTSGDDKLTKWLSPTINVLYAFSSALGAGVGLVSSLRTIPLRSTILDHTSRYSHPRTSSFPVLASFSR
jgi:hypothetical protein